MIIGVFLFAISAAIYLFSPNDYSQIYCSGILIVYILSSVWFFRKSLYKKNYFNFNVLFLLSYFFVNFVYPVFIYPNNPYYFSVYRFDFNQLIITKATALALLGSSSYILGALFMQTKKIEKSNHGDIDSRWYSYISKILMRISFLIIGLFLIFVGRNFFMGVFNSYSKISTYLLIPFISVFGLTIITSFLSKNNLISGKNTNFRETFNKPLFIFIIIVVIMFFYVGDRGPALQILMIVGALYSLYIRPIKFKTFAVSVIAGMFILMFISYARTSDSDVASYENSIKKYYERGIGGFRFDSIFESGRDLIVNNRNLYIAVDYTDKNKINFGKTMISQILAIVPGLQNLYVHLFKIDINQITSGQLISNLINEGSGGAGLGNDFIGDIYMSFGAIGVIVLMVIFGYVNSKFYLYALKTNNIYYIIAYVVSISYAIYFPRSSYFIAFRPILWPIIIIMILKYVLPLKPRIIIENQR